MKQIFDVQCKIKLSQIIGGALVAATLVSGTIYWFYPTSLWGMVMGSLTAGLIVAIIQFLMAKREYEMLEKIEDLELVKVLYNRDDRTYYENLIRKSNKSIKVMGVTAKRFFEHFADTHNGAPDNARVLLVAMERGVNVQILLPHEDFLSEDKKVAHRQVKHTLQEIQRRNYTGKIEIKYFQHTPAHSIFMVDNNCIVGPVFERVESKYTPALHLKKDSPFAVKYLEHFDEEWNSLNE